VKVAVLGAGAFGTALAVALVRGGKDVTLIARDLSGFADVNPKLPGVSLSGIRLSDTPELLCDADVVLAAVPTQKLGAALTEHKDTLADKCIVACCKGFEIATGQGPTEIIQRALPDAQAAILSGPSFAADIGQGLPTALTLAASFDLEALQDALSTPLLRLYRSNDPKGVEVGGALKNVIAIACGICIGEGMGESARAALMTRGFAEIQRLGAHFGAEPKTLMGLSGFGDLALTCMSAQSRNYRYGLALGKGDVFDPSITVEGATTAQAIASVADTHDLDLPICQAVAAIGSGQLSTGKAIEGLLSRPLTSE